MAKKKPKANPSSPPGPQHASSSAAVSVTSPKDADVAIEEAYRIGNYMQVRRLAKTSLSARAAQLKATIDVDGVSVLVGISALCVAAFAALLTLH